jgi:hypothetical protein
MNDDLDKPKMEDGELVIPETRFSCPNAVRGTFRKLFEDDKDSSKARAQEIRMFNGARPYSEMELKKAQQSFRTNVNFGEGEDTLSEALTAYIDMMQSVETLYTVRTKFGADPNERRRYSDAISRKMTKLIRKKWNKYFHRYLLNATKFVSGAVSFNVFPDHITWQYDVKGFGEFYVPRDCDATEDSVPYAFVVGEMEVAELYAKIRDEESARAMGWDVEEAQKALVSAARRRGQGSTTYDSWERLAAALKSDDLYTSSQCDRVPVIYTIVREFDGKVSMLINTREPAVHVNGNSNDGKDDKFLYSRPGIYDTMAQAFVSFTFGVGMDGKYYGIRGLGNKIMAPVQTNNRMLCQGIDGAMMSAAMPIRPKNESALGKALIHPRGPYMVIHPDAELVDARANNFSQNTLLISQQMSRLIASKAGSYTAARALPESKDMSQYEASARISNAATLSATNLVLYLVQSENLYREQTRRMIAPDYPETVAGGREIKEALQELWDEEGVPPEAWYDVDPQSVTVTFPVGAGSQAARSNAFRRLAEIAPAMDEEGQRNFYRDRVADAMGGYEHVDRYIPPTGVIRLSDASKTAMLENELLTKGSKIDALSEEFHIAHLDQHTAKLLEFITAVDNGQVELTAVVEQTIGIHDHATQHLEFMAGNPITMQDAARFRQVLQQTGEIILNGMRKLQAERQANPQAGPEQPDAKQQEYMMKLAFQRQNMEMKLEEMARSAELKMNIEMMKASQSAALADAKAKAALSPFAAMNSRATP